MFTGLVQEVGTVVSFAGGRVTIDAPENTRDGAELAAERRALSAKAARPFLERSSQPGFPWVGCQFPTNGSAAEAEMSLSAYEDFLYRACLCDHDDPVAAWRAQAQEVVIGRRHRSRALRRARRNARDLCELGGTNCLPRA